MKKRKINLVVIFQIIVIIVLLIFGTTTLNAQLKVGNNPKTLAPNTVFEIESTSGKSAVFSKDSAFLGLGTTTPSQRLHVVGQVRIETLTSGAASDSIVTIDANGILKRRNLSSIVSTASTTMNVTAEQTGNYSALATDDIILYNCNTAGIFLTLPTSGIPIGKRYYVSNKGSNLVDLSPAVRETQTVNLPAGQSIMLMYVGGTGAGSWSIMTGF